MANLQDHAPKVLLQWLIFTSFVAFRPVTSCEPQLTRNTFASEEVFNVSAIMASRRSSQSTRTGLMALLAAATRSTNRERTKRSQQWSPFDRGSKGTNMEAHSVVDMDNDFLHAPKDALVGLRSLAFAPRCSGFVCTDVHRRRPRDTILLSSINSDDWFVSSSSCSANVFVDRDTDRWPQALLKVECACEDIKCSDRGPHTCTTVSAPVIVLRRWFDSDVWHSYEELVPVGCVCASMRGRLMHHSVPDTVRR